MSTADAHTATTAQKLSFMTIYAPATVLLVMARREKGRQLFSSEELLILALSIVGAGIGIAARAAGWTSL